MEQLLQSLSSGQANPVIIERARRVRGRREIAGEVEAQAEQNSL
jgi:hypothetical protein